jgi:hypothetical protein
MKTATQIQQQIEAERIERFTELLKIDLPGRRVRVTEASIRQQEDGASVFKVEAFIDGTAYTAYSEYYELALKKIRSDFARSQERTQEACSLSSLFQACADITRPERIDPLNHKWTSC